MVTARVSVDVRMSLPLPHDVSSVLNFLPIRGILSQAGGLVAKTVLNTLTPELCKALVKDYEDRMLAPASQQRAVETTVSPLDEWKQTC